MPCRKGKHDHQFKWRSVVLGVVPGHNLQQMRNRTEAVCHGTPFFLCQYCRVEAVLQLKADTEAAAAFVRGRNERRAEARAKEDAEHEAEREQLAAKGLNPYQVSPRSYCRDDWRYCQNAAGY